MLSASMISRCGKTLLSGSLGCAGREDIGPAVFLIDGDRARFDGMDSVVKEIYVTAGELEVFLDQSVAIASELRTRNPGLVVRLDVFPKQAHDFILLEGWTRTTGVAMKAMRE